MRNMSILITIFIHIEIFDNERVNENNYYTYDMILRINCERMLGLGSDVFARFVIGRKHYCTLLQ